MCKTGSDTHTIINAFTKKYHMVSELFNIIFK